MPDQKGWFRFPLLKANMGQLQNRKQKGQLFKAALLYSCKHVSTYNCHGYIVRIYFVPISKKPQLMCRRIVFIVDFKQVFKNKNIEMGQEHFQTNRIRKRYRALPGSAINRPG
jgi:hypothetical protein